MQVPKSFIFKPVKTSLELKEKRRYKLYHNKFMRYSPRVHQNNLAIFPEQLMQVIQDKACFFLKKKHSKKFFWRITYI